MPLADYVGFIKKIMKLMQLSFPELAKVEVELVQEKELDQIPERPSEYSKLQTVQIVKGKQLREGFKNYMCTFCRKFYKGQIPPPPPPVCRKLVRFSNKP